MPITAKRMDSIIIVIADLRNAYNYCANAHNGQAYGFDPSYSPEGTVHNAHRGPLTVKNQL